MIGLNLGGLYEVFAERTDFVPFYFGRKQHILAGLADSMLLWTDFDWDSGLCVILLLADQTIQLCLVGFEGSCFGFTTHL